MGWQSGKNFPKFSYTFFYIIIFFIYLYIIIFYRLLIYFATLPPFDKKPSNTKGLIGWQKGWQKGGKVAELFFN
jgi:hypothetical protein